MPPPGAAPPGRHPSGLFPAGRQRPSYREPHPVRAAGLLAGLGAGALWMLLFGLIASTLRGYGWWTILAGLLAWGAALLLGRAGDRGVAAGVAISAAVGWSIAAVVIAAYWSTRLDWPLW
nr:hypothetical protein [Micromonospora sp. NBRC 107566]